MNEGEKEKKVEKKGKHSAGAPKKNDFLSRDSDQSH